MILTVLLTVMKVKLKTPVAAAILLLLFFAIVGIWYLFTKGRQLWRRFRRWWRKVTGGRHFWGYVLSVALFGGFALFYLWIVLTRT